MLRLEKKKGKAFLWDMRLTAEAAKHLINGLSHILYMVHPTDFGKAEQETFKRTYRASAGYTQPRAGLSNAPRHKYRHSDKVVRKLSLANIFGLNRKKPEPAPAPEPVIVPYPWTTAYAHAFEKRRKRSHSRRPMPVTPKKTSSVATTRDRVLEMVFQIGKRINTWEFWLGFGFGLATRLSTRILIMETFSEMPDYATMVSFIACAVAGLTAGMAAHLIRAFYRNATRVPGAPKELYFSRPMFEAALIGLLGGMFGGCATNFSTLVARSSAFTVGMATGAAASIFHSVVKNGWRTDDGHFAWERLVFQSAIYTFAGGILGVVSADLLGSSDSIASVPTGGSDSILYLRPSRPIGPEACGTDQCFAPPPPMEAQPQMPLQMALPPLPPPPAEEVIRITIHERGHAPSGHHGPRISKPHVAPRKEELCYPAKHVKHVKHLKHLKPPKEPAEIIIRRTIVPAQLPPIPPPQTVMPPPGMPPQYFAPLEPPSGPPPEMPVRPMFNPCETGECGGEPCYDSEAINLQGPCSDPSMPCVERVSFNDEGLATRAVLEPADRQVTHPYYEFRRDPEDMRLANWNVKEQGNLIPARGTENAGELSLVMPLANNKTLALASSAPRPA